MSTWAFVADGLVRETTDTDPADRFNPEMIWLACGDDVVEGWTYDGTAFAAPPVPVPTPDQLLAAKISAGIAITSTSTPGLNATYAMDPVTISQIQSVAQDSAAGLGLPGGAPSFTYPDMNGQPRTFSEPQIIALYKAIRNLMFALQTQTAILAHGGPAAWPLNTATIV